MRLRWFYSALLICAPLLHACSRQPDLGIVAQQIFASAEHRYLGTLWLPDNTQLVWVSNNDSDGLWYVTVADQTARELELPVDNNCRRVDYPSTAVLPDGRLGVVMRCADRWPDRPTPLGSESYLLAYDWVTKEVERIVEAPLPNSSLSRRFSWNPQMTQGVQELSGLYGMLFWLTPEAPEPMTVTVSNGNVNWLMSENYQAHVEHRESSSDTGIARAPTWSSNNEIAFFASLNAIGRDGPDRTHGPWSIYLMHTNKHEPVAVLDDVYGPVTLDWSPDGHWLAFSGKVGRSNRTALWLFSPSLKQAHLVQEGVFVSVAWAPASNALMAMECVGEVCETRALWQFELTGLHTSTRHPPPLPRSLVFFIFSLVFSVTNVVMVLSAWIIQREIPHPPGAIEASTGLRRVSE